MARSVLRRMWSRLLLAALLSLLPTVSIAAPVPGHELDFRAVSFWKKNEQEAENDPVLKEAMMAASPENWSSIGGVIIRWTPHNLLTEDFRILISAVTDDAGTNFHLRQRLLPHTSSIFLEAGCPAVDCREGAGGAQTFVVRLLRRSPSAQRAFSSSLLSLRILEVRVTCDTVESYTYRQADALHFDHLAVLVLLCVFVAIIIPSGCTMACRRRRHGHLESRDRKPSVTDDLWKGGTSAAPLPSKPGVREPHFVDAAQFKACKSSLPVPGPATEGLVFPPKYTASSGDGPIRLADGRLFANQEAFFAEYDRGCHVSVNPNYEGDDQATDEDEEERASM